MCHHKVSATNAFLYLYKMKEIFKHYLQSRHYSQFDIKAILFDMDGVLYDSMPAHAKSWQETFEEYGFESTTPEEFYLHEGRIGSRTIEMIYERERHRTPSPEEINEFYTRKTELFYRYNSGDIISGANETLRHVKACGWLPILVTGSGQPSLLERLDNNFPDIFTPETMITAHNVKKGKPHPEPYLMALQKAGNIQPWQALVVENAPLGVESAHKANIFTIAVNTGPLSNSVLKEAGANLVLDSMKKLNECLDEIVKITKTVVV